MRAEKAKKFKELKGNRNSPEYEEWFLRYRPSDKLDKNENDDVDKQYNKNKQKRNITKKQIKTTKTTKTTKSHSKIKEINKKTLKNRTNSNKNNGVLDFLKFKDV
jgi:hypothetical protein